jgi:FemAB-related protein (PEP-CTERM system-associated)
VSAPNVEAQAQDDPTSRADSEAAETRAVQAELELRPLHPADDAALDAYVDAHAGGSPFHLSGWRRATEKVFGHEGHDLGAFRDDRLVGVLPLVLCKKPFGPPNLISTPYGVYGGPLTDDDEAESALVQAACDLAERERVGRLELRCIEAPKAPAGLDLVEHDLYATFVREVPEDPAEIMKRMPKRARAEVRKGIKQGLELSEGAWFVDDLARLFMTSKRSLGSPALPAAWFKALQRELGPERTAVHLARVGTEAVAATMSFIHRDTLYLYYIGTSDVGNRTYKATNFLVTTLQEITSERGLKQFDLGRSRVDSGPYSFKKHQGFEPTPLAYRLKLVRSTSKPSFNPSNPKTKLLRDTWTKMPLWLARQLSTPLSRYLP